MTRPAGSRSGPRYTLEQFQSAEELGAGSFGTVKRVVNTETGEVFAMKVLEKERVKRKRLEEQLKREVLTQIRVKHQNVVRLHYYFEDASKIYCLLEFAERGTLFSFMKSLGGGVREDQAAQLFGDSADGINYLHGLKIVHRDLKPENILLFGPKPTAKIGDFGWCVELTLEEPERKTFCGTMDYLPPEMLTDEPHDFSVDLWALGVLLFEIILGRAPFEGGSHRDQVGRILAVRYELPPHFPEGAADIVRRLLVFARDQRMPLAEVLGHPWILERRALASPGVPAAGGLEETQAVPRGATLQDQAIDDRTCFVPRGPPGGLPDLPAVLVESPGNSDFPSIIEGTPLGTASTNCSGERVPSASPERSVGNERSPSPLPDLLSSVRDAGHCLSDLDQRILAASKGKSAKTPPSTASSASSIDAKREWELSPVHSPAVSSCDDGLVKTLVVSNVPRPKALSRRSQPSQNLRP